MGVRGSLTRGGVFSSRNVRAKRVCWRVEKLTYERSIASVCIAV